jgi:hypothetical protein
VTLRLLLGYLGLTLFVLVALEVPLGIQNGRTERRNLEAKVEHDATNLASIAQDAVRTRSSPELRAVAAIAYRYSNDTGGRVLVVARNGIAVIDTKRLSTARWRRECATQQRCTRTSSTSRFPWRQAASSTGRCGSPIRLRPSMPASSATG